ncbi:hypothetical protein BY996DRAFT_6426225 [Phakopsora pachyrhizi]|nr:hypothetical protein BY996DRAFT_6426225 [Phakopsora pachyrhizi]
MITVNKPSEADSKKSEQLLRSKVLKTLTAKDLSEPVRHNYSKKSLGSESKVMKISALLILRVLLKSYSRIGVPDGEPSGRFCWSCWWTSRAWSKAAAGWVGSAWKKLGAVVVIEKAKIEEHLQTQLAIPYQDQKKLQNFESMEAKPNKQNLFRFELSKPQLISSITGGTDEDQLKVFEGKPGHCRSEKIIVKAAQPPSIQPWQTKASALRTGQTLPKLNQAAQLRASVGKLTQVNEERKLHKKDSRLNENFEDIKEEEEEIEEEEEEAEVELTVEDDTDEIEVQLNKIQGLQLKADQPKVINGDDDGYGLLTVL